MYSSVELNSLFSDNDLDIPLQLSYYKLLLKFNTYHQIMRTMRFTTKSFLIVVLTCSLPWTLAVKDDKHSKSSFLQAHFCQEAVFEKNFIKKLWNTEPLSKYQCNKFGHGFPSLGGYGCSCPCDSNTSSTESMFVSSNHKWPQDLQKNLKTAQTMLEERGIKWKIAPQIHQNFTMENLKIPFLHHCCITPNERMIIKRIISSQLPSAATMVSFQQLSCYIMGPKGDTSIILELDAPSKSALSMRALLVTKQLHLNGVSTTGSIRRKSQYGIIVATVPFRYRCELALSQINERIPPGKWTENPVALQHIVCPQC